MFIFQNDSLTFHFHKMIRIALFFFMSILSIWSEGKNSLSFFFFFFFAHQQMMLKNMKRFLYVCLFQRKREEKQNHSRSKDKNGNVEKRKREKYVRNFYFVSRSYSFFSATNDIRRKINIKKKIIITAIFLHIHTTRNIS